MAGTRVSGRGRYYAVRNLGEEERFTLFLNVLRTKGE
jgi:hypothetical protein